MSPEDRELLQTLRRQQEDLQHSLARIGVQLGELEARAFEQEAPVDASSELPPFPTEHLPPFPTQHLPPVPPLETATEEDLPPLPAHEPAPVTGAAPPPFRPSAPKPPIELQFGRWLTAIGAVFGIITLAFILAYPPVYHRLGAAGLIGISALVSVAVYILGERLERARAAFVLFGRSLMALALSWLYLTAYASHYYDPLCVIHSPLVAGFLLLAWSAYVLLLAERKKSQVLAVFSVFLAYISSAINPIGAFTMTADFILAVTAVVFLLRNGWAALSYLSLFGTYLAFLRRLLFDENGDFVIDTSRALHFWPLAVYLLGAWATFTAAVLFSNSVTFRGGKRLAFLSLNNGALALLLALATHIVGYDLGSLGWSLLDCGLLLLVTSLAARVLRSDEIEVAESYLGQGLTLLTTGIVVVYTGISRGVLLAVETLFLGAAGAYTRNVLLRGATDIVAFLATLFLIKEIGIDAHHPWLLGIGGALIMRVNAWLARRDIRADPPEQERFVLNAAYYCLLALILVFTAMYTELSDATLPPALALVALALTFSVYIVKLYKVPEVPPTAQSFLLAAQGFALFPIETGEPMPWWSSGLVSLATLFAITWWTHQRVSFRGPWVMALNLVYSVALAGLVYNAVRPHVEASGWLIAASCVSLGALLYGALFRVWSIALVGQLFLLIAVVHFFVPPDGWDLHSFSWSWVVAAVPIAVVFATGHAAHQWIRASPEMAEPARHTLRFFACAYQALALVMLCRWIFAVIPAKDQIATLLLLGTALIAWNVTRLSATGARASYLPTLIGGVLYLHRFDVDPLSVTTFLNGLAVIAFILQPLLLRRNPGLLSAAEAWILVLLSGAFGWFFVSAWVVERIHPSYLTMGWALFGMFLFVLGLACREHRQRWCGLGIVLAAILRVLLWDFWGFSTGYRLLTFLVLTLVTLSLGFIYARFADRVKPWL